MSILNKIAFHQNRRDEVPNQDVARELAQSRNQAEMNAGTELHRQHGRKVVASSLTRTLAVVLLLVALALLVAFCTARFI